MSKGLSAILGGIMMLLGATLLIFLPFWVLVGMSIFMALEWIWLNIIHTFGFVCGCMLIILFGLVWHQTKVTPPYV